MQPLGGGTPTPCAGPRPQDQSHQKGHKKLHKMVQFRASGKVWASSYGRFYVSEPETYLTRKNTKNYTEWSNSELLGWSGRRVMADLRFRAWDPSVEKERKKTMEIHPITSF